MGKHSRDASSSDDSDSSREHRHRSKKEKKEKKDKKEKHKKHKKRHGKDKERDKEKERLLKEAKRFLKQKLKSGDPDAAAAAAGGSSRGGRDAAAGPAAPAEPPYEGSIDPISETDYFLKNAEFAAWLKDSRGVFFSEQSTEDNRSAFADFVAAWNGRQLPARLYKGEVAAARTGHSWAIKGAGGRGQALAQSGAVGMAAALDEEMNLKEQARAQVLAERQQQKREAKEWLDEAVPRLAGKDKALEEKRARRELGKAGRDSPEFVARGMDVMGGGQDDFAAAKAREAARQDRRGRFQAARTAEVQQRLAAQQAAEAAKMDQFKALLAAGPIQIAKRQQ